MIFVGSAAEINGGSVEPRGPEESAASLAGARANAVALEVPVNATGTRPGSGPDKRELFSEDTETVLLFADGAMIRLSAAVATGQLIFLTNKKTNIEVVCQVVGKRAYRPTSCYVELQFTESLNDFWGVTFPAQEPGKVTAVPVEVESVESAEVTEDGAEVHGPAPTDQEVEKLREEVELLRKHLAELKQAETSARAVAKMAEPAAPTQVAAEKPELMQTSEPAPVNAPVVNDFTPAVVVAPPSAPPGLAKNFGLSSDVAEAKRSEQVAAGRTTHVGMALPNRPAPKIDPEQEVIDQLLPQPALDFSKAPTMVHGADPNDPYSIYKPTRAKMGKWTLVALMLVLAGVVGAGVWKSGVVQSIVSARRGKEAATVAAAPVTATGVPKAAATNGAEAGNAVSGEGKAAAEVATPADVRGAVNGKDLKPAKASDFHAAGPTPDAANLVAEKKNGSGGNAAKRANSRGKGVNKKQTVEVAEEKKTPEEAPVPDDAPIVPVKLLKAVSPIYPPDAMRGFITGDVRLQAEVDATGQIGKMEVISGPAALRPAAIEAMKQYVYAPATKGGKGVASTVKVTIKFWFDP